MQRCQVRHLVRFLLVLRLICGLIHGPINLVDVLADDACCEVW